MVTIFYIAAVVAIVATRWRSRQKNVVHGLLYLIVSLLAVALMFLVLGAPFVAALEVIIYAGADHGPLRFVMMCSISDRGPSIRSAVGCRRACGSVRSC